MPEKTEAEKTQERDLYSASQWQLMWRRFKRHRLAIIGGTVLGIFYLTALFAPFLTPYDPAQPHDDYLNVAPVGFHFIDEDGNFSLRPFVYELDYERDLMTLEIIYKLNKDKKHYINFFVEGSQYKLLGLIPTNIHLIGVEEPGYLFLFGTDKIGRDLFTRNIFAARISLTIGLVGVAFTFILGCFFGGISGYFGGAIDMIVQRAIEFMLSIPTLPLWMALSAALPRQWSQIQIYFAITVILALRNWCGLARVVRGKLMSMKTNDYVMAAKIAGASESRIIIRHLLPGFLSYLVVNVTLAIPAMIIGETALSFLGLGLQAPIVSWGVLLNQAQNIRTVALHPWIMIPGVFVIIAVLAFNFIGDGLRDAADPYKEV